MESASTSGISGRPKSASRGASSLFGWDERMVRFFFQAPVRQPSAPEDTSAALVLHAAFVGCTQSRLSKFNQSKARFSNSERRRWPSLTTTATPTG